MTRALLRSALAFVALSFLSVTAHAGLFRAYVSSTGNDANACTLQAPCRLLPAALAAVNDGGEIWMLDSANYNTGSVNIAKSVNILAIPGAVGSVLNTGSDAIDINTAGVKVALRNLVITSLPGAPNSGYGINMTAGAGLTIEDCLIARNGGYGIVVIGSADVRITDTTIRDNGSLGLFIGNGVHATVTRATISANGGNGVHVVGSIDPSTTTADIADSTIDANQGNGVYAWAPNAGGTAGAVGIIVSVRDSRLVRNVNAGALAQSDLAGAQVTLTVSSSQISNNAYGIVASTANSRVWVSGNTVNNNGFGFVGDFGSVFESAGNNALRNNGNDTFGTITAIATK